MENVAMLGSPRIGLKPLAGLCRRLSTSLGAGVDMRKVWAREAERATGVTKQRFAFIADAANRGTPVSEAVEECGDYFPELFRGMMVVGEKAGHQAEVLRELADRYDHQLVLRRTFLSAISWPMVQLGMAVCVIGLLIWILGMIPGKTDILGFGLVGNDGLIKYLLIVGGVALAISLAIRAIMRGALWIRPVQRMILRIPKLGRAFQTLALARLAWTMHVTFGSGMDLKEAIALSLRSSRNAEYSDKADAVWASIRRGSDLHEALDATGSYPRDFLDTIEVGEQSGRLSEALGKLAEQYEDEARIALAILTRALGLLVWLLVAGLIIMMIFRLFSFYLGAINGALNM
jgi:type II secretory pathway component PulF